MILRLLKDLHFGGEKIFQICLCVVLAPHGSESRIADLKSGKKLLLL